MIGKVDKALRDASLYNAAMTREQFLFYEMRTTAELINDGLDKETAVGHIVSENLFQYPTEKSRKRITRLSSTVLSRKRMPCMA